MSNGHLFPWSDEAVFDIPPNARSINGVAEKEKGKPYRVGYSFEMAEREQRGLYTCEVIRRNKVTSDDDEEPELKLEYYVRVKGEMCMLWNWAFVGNQKKSTPPLCYFRQTRSTVAIPWDMWGGSGLVHYYSDLREAKKQSRAGWERHGWKSGSVRSINI